MKLLRTIRLDPSDTFVFEHAAEPGEWAVSGAFVFWNEDVAQLEGKARVIVVDVHAEPIASLCSNGSRSSSLDTSAHPMSWRREAPRKRKSRLRNPSAISPPTR